MDNKTKHISKETEKLDYLDALRGIAILMVISIHVFYVGATTGILNLSSLPFRIGALMMKISYMGAYGVTLFFIVSAYTLFRSFDLRKTDKHYITKYFIRRLFRIAPAYYLVLFVTLILIDIIINSSAISKTNILTHFFFINGFFPAYFNNILGEWTIFTEIMFYIFLPFILYFVYNRAQPLKFLIILYLVLLTICSFLYLQIVDYYPVLRGFFLLSPFFQMPVFVIGLITYYLLNRTDINFKSLKSVEYFIYYLIFMIIYVLFSIIVLSNIPHYKNELEYQVMGILFIPLIFFLAQSKSKLVNLFNNKITVFLGKISFSLYLIHYLIFLYLMPRIFMLLSFDNYYERIILTIFVNLIVVIVLAYISYKFVEQPGIQLGKKICAKL